MESRQVTLLTKGYFSGRLNFTYPNSTSKLREQFIINELERECIADIISKRLVLDAQIIPLNPKQVKLVYKDVEEYTELILPYLAKSSKINKTGETDFNAEQIAYFRKIREEQKERAKTIKKKE